MKENIFLEIGNKIKENKRKRELKEERYWKLKPIDRIEYINHIERIEKEENRKRYPLFLLTSIMFKIWLALFILFGLLSFAIDYPVIDLLNLLKPLTLTFIKFIYWIVIIDILSFIFGIIFDKREKRVKELNKKFKII